MRKCGFALFFPVIYATFITFALALQRKTLAFPEIFWHYPQTVNIICSMRWTWFLCVSLHFFFQWYTASALPFLVLGILFSTSLNVGLEAPSVGWIFSWSSPYFFERQVYQNLKRSTTISFLWHEKFLALEKLYV